jgi:sialate O-acetylesterase
MTTARPLVRASFPFLAALAPALGAQLEVASPFGDHMVLQRELPITIWGKAKPGASVSLKLGAVTSQVVAEEGGRWSVTLAPMPAGGPHQIVIQTDGEERQLSDVMVGEVWLCSGQSNMEWSLAQLKEAAESDPLLRLLKVPHKATGVAVEVFDARWNACDPGSAATFSAVAYHFGRELRARLHVPIGLVQSTWGGTPAESWTRRAAMLRHEVTQPIVDRWDETVARWPEAKKAYEAALARWEKEKEQEQGKPADKPRPPAGPESPGCASSLWNGMIAPLVPLTFRGAIWYQGESNATRAFQYRTLFPAMIRDWRAAFGREFPFLFVQLANFVPAENARIGWAELREAQLLALQLPATGMAVTIDIGDSKDIHPKNKVDVGKRLAAAARGLVYGEKVEPSGPLFERATFEGGKARVTFRHAGGGLVQKGESLTGFSIAGEDQKFFPAVARIEGNEVVVTNPDVARPVAVRYGFECDPRCNLYNQDGLPASPFRSDDWPLVTKDAR